MFPSQGNLPRRSGGKGGAACYTFEAWICRRRRTLRILIIVGTLLLITAACSPTETTTPQPVELLPTQPAPAPSALPTSGPATQPAVQPATIAPPAGAVPVSLQVLTPQDGAVVNAPQITVSGMASPGAVVTVNDDILIAGPDGLFQDPVTLTEGLNLIEVLASNTSGSEASVELTVTYEP